jgi:MYXO-CTERM domain-containing protein
VTTLRHTGLAIAAASLAFAASARASEHASEVVWTEASATDDLIDIALPDPGEGPGILDWPESEIGFLACDGDFSMDGFADATWFADAGTEGDLDAALLSLDWRLELCTLPEPWSSGDCQGPAPTERGDPFAPDGTMAFAIPAPGALAVLAAAGLTRRRRR